MPNILQEEEIQRLITVNKTVLNPGVRWKEGEGSKRKDFELEGPNKESLSLKVRQNTNLTVPNRINDFSVILMFHSPQGENYILLRYNGPSHRHFNKIEKNWLEKIPHIHTATERYQRDIGKIDGFAEPAEGKYHDLDSALRAMCADCNITGVNFNSNPTNQLDIWK